MPLSFGEDSDRRAAEAWQHGVVLVDRSHWGRLRLSGDGRKEFLHGQTTADINCLQPGQLCESVRLSSFNTCPWCSELYSICSDAVYLHNLPTLFVFEQFTHYVGTVAGPSKRVYQTSANLNM